MDQPTENPNIDLGADARRPGGSSTEKLTRRSGNRSVCPATGFQHANGSG